MNKNRLQKLAGLLKENVEGEEQEVNEAQSVMPTVGTIRKIQYNLEYLDKWLRGEPGYHVKNATSTFQQLEKSIGDIKKFTLAFEKELKTNKK